MSVSTQTVGANLTARVHHDPSLGAIKQAFHASAETIRQVYVDNSLNAVVVYVKIWDLAVGSVTVSTP